MPSGRKALTLYDDYHAMMSDAVRAKAYRKAIAQVVREGDVVVDLGAGLGILSLLALRAGASKVYAIEHGHAATLLPEIAARNGVRDRLIVIAENSKDVTLPERADVLLSETLGSFGVDENTLEFTLDARERFLKPGGRMLPQRLQLYLAPVTAPQTHAKIAYWANVDGFDYTPALQESVTRMHLFDADARKLLAKPACCADIDLSTDDDTTLSTRVLFELERKSTLHGLAGWFAVELCEGVSISTGPGDKRTHWRQAFFPFVEPPSVVRGDYLEVTLSVRGRDGDEASTGSDNTTITYSYRCTQRGAARC